MGGADGWNGVFQSVLEWDGGGGGVGGGSKAAPLFSLRRCASSWPPASHRKGPHSPQS